MGIELNKVARINAVDGLGMLEDLGWGGADAKDKIPDDPWEFCMKCVVTFDERAREKGKEPEQRFPDKPHLRLIAHEWFEEKFIAIEKSSQIMVTWLIAALHLWLVLKYRGQRVAWFCLKQELAEAHIKDRIYRIYTMMPGNFAKPPVRVLGGEFLVYHDGLDKLPTSRIAPMAAEKDSKDAAAVQMRSLTWTAAVKDESAFYKGAEELHFSLLPRCGRLTDVSTPNGMTFFRKMMHGEANTVSVKTVRPEMQLIMRGIWGWRRGAFRCLRVHHNSDPDKDMETAVGSAWRAHEEAKMNFDTRKIARELDIDSDASAGKPVYYDTDRVVITEQQYRSWLKVFRGWDFGYQWPTCIVFQVEDIWLPDQKYPRQIVHVLREMYRQDCMIDQFGDYAVSECKRLFPGATFKDYGDPAGNQRSDKGPKGELNTSVKIMASKGVIVQSISSRIELGVNVVQGIISAGNMEIDPQCQMLIQAIKSGYVRDDEGNPIRGEDGHPWTDFCDGLRYGMVNVFGYNYQSVGGQTVLRAHEVPKGTQATVFNKATMKRPAIRSENLYRPDRVIR